ncbi:MAG: DnaJ domain-containing protein [Armatimonadetes bacterium]|nr:DnaJ domain-containing protein [Armatimonadota bacterium]
MSLQRTYYEILGIEATATPEVIKQRYRHLAKRYHPDAVPPEEAATAHRTFVAITEAYEVLSDPRRREAYDRDLALKRRQREREAAARAGAGRARGASGPPPPPRTASPPSMEQLLYEARLSLAHGRFAQAQASCEEILRRDPRHAGAYALLGEIRRSQGRVDESIHYFMKAVQCSTPGGRHGAPPRMAAPRDFVRPGRLPLSLWPVVAIGCLMVLGLLLLPLVYPGEAIGVWPVSEWTGSLLLGMAGASLLAGFLASITGLLGPAGADVWFDLVRTRGRPVPVWVLLLPLSVLFFPLALAFYCVLVLQARVTQGLMVRLLGMTTGAVLFFAALVPAGGQTLLLGGNLVFPCLLLGSFGGVLLRDTW